MDDLLKELKEIASKNKYDEPFRVVSIWRVANYKSKKEVQKLAEKIMPKVAERVSKIMPLLTTWLALTFDTKDNPNGTASLQLTLEKRIESLVNESSDFSDLFKSWCRTNKDTLPEKLIEDRILYLLDTEQSFLVLIDNWKLLVHDCPDYSIKTKVEDRIEKVIEGFNDVTHLKNLLDDQTPNSIPHIIILLRIEELQN